MWRRPSTRPRGVGRVQHRQPLYSYARTLAQLCSVYARPGPRHVPCVVAVTTRTGTHVMMPRWSHTAWRVPHNERRAVSSSLTNQKQSKCAKAAPTNHTAALSQRAKTHTPTLSDFISFSQRTFLGRKRNAAEHSHKVTMCALVPRLTGHEKTVRGKPRPSEVSCEVTNLQHQPLSQAPPLPFRHASERAKRWLSDASGHAAYDQA